MESNNDGTAKPFAEARGSALCLDCNHGKEHYTHLTGCVRCCYPRERAPQVVDRSVLRMGYWCVPNATAAICPHYAPNSDYPEHISGEKHQNQKV